MIQEVKPKKLEPILEMKVRDAKKRAASDLDCHKH